MTIQTEKMTSNAAPSSTQPSILHGTV